MKHTIKDLGDSRIEIEVEVVRKLIPDFFAPISIEFTLLKFIWELRI